jgi:cyclic pyranopterin phosphate synthase
MMDKPAAEAKITRLPGSTGLRDSLDRPMHDLRISVMDRCNFRCPYCMPRERYHDNYRFLKTAERLSFDEIVRLARVFLRFGVSKLRLTGGEPLLRNGLADLVGELSTLPGIDDLALTTNGVLLAQHASELKANGLDRVTVSLDSLDERVFAQMSGGFGGLQQVLAGIEKSLEAGLAPVKVNAVVQRGVNDHTILDLLDRFRSTDVVVRLIEYMDVGNRNEWRPDQVVPSKELLARVQARWPVSPRASDYRGEVAERYVYDDGAGEIGFISSVSSPFCGNCSRARLSSDGMLYTCLFATQGTDLRAPLRAGASDDELAAIVRNVWTGRRDRYSEQRVELRLRGRAQGKVEMNYIGG